MLYSMPCRLLKITPIASCALQVCVLLKTARQKPSYFGSRFVDGLIHSMIHNGGMWTIPITLIIDYDIEVHHILQRRNDYS